MLKRVCAVLDIECFQHKDLIIYREVGFAPVYKECEFCVKLERGCDYGFKVLGLQVVPPFTPPAHDKALWKTFNTIKYRITGLNFYPDEDKAASPHEAIPFMIQAWYQVYSDSERDVVAYKGGSIERILLQSLGIPSLNLEDFGIQSFHTLPPEERSWFSDYYCGQHRFSEGVGIFSHCPRMETAFYRNEVFQQVSLCELLYSSQLYNKNRYELYRIYN